MSVRVSRLAAGVAWSAAVRLCDDDTIGDVLANPAFEGFCRLGASTRSCSGTARDGAVAW